MTRIDNSRIFYEGVYADASVLVPKSTTYKAGTVLGRNSDGNLTAFSTDNNSDSFTTSPLYILAQTLTNESTTADETFDLVRVFDSGVVDASELIFIKEADATDVTVLDAMKTNNFRLINVEEQSVESSLS